MMSSLECIMLKRILLCLLAVGFWENSFQVTAEGKPFYIIHCVFSNNQFKFDLKMNKKSFLLD